MMRFIAFLLISLFATTCTAAEVFFTDDPAGNQVQMMRAAVGRTGVFYVYADLLPTENVRELRLSINAFPGSLVDFIDVSVTNDGEWDTVLEPQPNENRDEIFNFGGTSDEGFFYDGLLRLATIQYSAAAIGNVNMVLFPLSFNPSFGIRSEPNLNIVLVGDMNVNGLVDFDDIEFFVLGLEDPEEYEDLFGTPSSLRGDTDDDGDLDFDDIDGFVSLLTVGIMGRESQSVPEPSTFAMMWLSLFTIIVLRRR